MVTVGSGFRSRMPFLVIITLIALWPSFVGCKDSAQPSDDGKKVEAPADKVTVEVPVSVAAVDHLARLQPTFPRQLQEMFDESGELKAEYTKDTLHLLFFYDQHLSEEIKTFANVCKNRGVYDPVPDGGHGPVMLQVNCGSVLSHGQAHVLPASISRRTLCQRSAIPWPSVTGCHPSLRYVAMAGRRKSSVSR